MRRNRKRGLAKERILMVASSVLVLASLTVTGIWLGRDGSNQDQGYVVDLSSIENSTANGLAEEEVKIAENTTNQAVPADDLDYDPYFQETNSQKVENPDQSRSDSMSDTDGQEQTESAQKKEEKKYYLLEKKLLLKILKE